MPFDKEEAAALLQSDTYKKASPEVKKAIVERLRSEASAAGVATPHDTLSAQPKLTTSKGARSAAYTAIDRALPFLPAAGATIGGLLATPESGGAAAPIGAFEGGAIGEAARQGLNRAIFGEHTTPQDLATGVIEQGLLGGATEGLARGVGAVGSKVATPFAEAAPTVKAAKAGVGVRLTPGEAADSNVLKRVEELLTHIPGGAGPMEGFRAAQLADANRMTARQVEQLSTNRVSDEQAGQMVQHSLKQRASGVTDKYNEVKKLLGIDPKTFMSPEQIDEAVAKKVQFYKDMNGGTPPVVQALAEARRAAASPGAATIQKLAGANPEEVVSMVQRKMSLGELRQYNAMVPEQTRRQVQANLLQKMLNESSDAQSGTLDQRALAKALKQLGPQRGKLIFGEQWNALQEGSRLLNKIAPMATNQTGGLGKMHTMRTLIEVGGVAGAALGLSHGAYTAAAAVGGPMLAMRLISTALAHPQASAVVLKMLRGAAVTGARAIPYGVDALAIDPATDYRAGFAHTATNPATGHRVGSNDGEHWYDTQTGMAVP